MGIKNVQLLKAEIEYWLIFKQSRQSYFQFNLIKLLKFKI